MKILAQVNLAHIVVALPDLVEPYHLSLGVLEHPGELEAPLGVLERKLGFSHQQNYLGQLQVDLFFESVLESLLGKILDHI